MLSPRWKKIWSDLTINKTRTALVVLSIVVGIFAVGAIAGTSAIVDRESKTLWENVDPASATLVTTPFDLSLAEEIADLPEVAEVQVRRVVNGRALLDTEDGTTPQDIQLFAVPDYEAMALNRIDPESGAWPPPADQLLVERSAVDLLGVSEGDTLTVELPGGATREFTVAGVAYDLSQPAAAVLGIAYAYVSPETMAELVSEPGYNVLQFRLDQTTIDVSSLDEETLSQQVANDIRDRIQQQGVIVVTPPQIATPGEPPGYIFIVALLVVLGVIGAMTFLLSGFLIVNIVSALLSQQTKQIGIMKAVGAKTSQIVVMYLGMAAAFGVIALIIALPLSYLGARGLTTLIGDLNNYKITDFSAPAGVFVVQIVIGLVVPVAAAIIPVVGGTRTTVREALDSRGIEANSNSLFNRLLTGFRVVPRPILLSFRNTFRQRGRLFLTLLTLALAGAIFATVFTVRASLFATLDDALGYDDYSVAVNMGDAYDRQALLDTAAGVENVVAVEAWTQATERYRADDGTEVDVTVSGVTPDSQMIRPILNEGVWFDESDVENAIVINSNVADRGFSVGDTITLLLRGEATEWQIVGVARAIFVLDDAAWADYDALAASIGEAGLARALRIDTEPNDAATQNAVVEALGAAFADQGFLVDGSETFSNLESSLNTRFNVLVFSLLALALLLAVVGGLGIAGATSINVIERMREIGVMRSIGAANYQILGIFIIEAVFVGVIGWVLGSLLALPISRLLSDGVGIAFSNAPLTYQFDINGALLWLVLAVGLAVVFAFLPARRASQLTLREVLAYEG